MLARAAVARLALDCPALLLAVASAVAVAFAVPERVAADCAVSDCAVLLADALEDRALDDGLVDDGAAEVEAQLDDLDGDALADELLRALLEPAGEVWRGLDGALGLAEALLVTFAGPVPRFGGRLVTGGRTTVTSPTTGSGLSGSAEAPSR